MRTTALTLFLLASLLGLRTASAGDKPHASVAFAPTWESAVAEARLLNVPIVVHSHGFFCPPCLGMHAALLQNDDYIDCADDSTVEVIVLSQLAEGIEKDDPRAAEYESKVGGATVRYMVEFPGMTREQMLALGRSPAARYNKTDAVPYTCVVNPYTLEEIESWRGGGVSRKTIIESIERHTAALKKAHGDGMARKDLRKYEDAETEATNLVAEGEFAKALKTIDKAARKSDAWPQPMKDRVAAARASVVEAASEAIGEAQGRLEAEPKAARRALQRLRSKIRGTGLEDRLEEALAAARKPA